MPSDLCGLFVMAVTDDDPFGNSTQFYEDIVATTHAHNCSSAGLSAVAGAERSPGYSCTRRWTVGRSASESPVYYGADRIAVTSAYLLSLTNLSSVSPSITQLAKGTIDADGSFRQWFVSPLLPLEPTMCVSLEPTLTGRHYNSHHKSQQERPENSLASARTSPLSK